MEPVVVTRLTVNEMVDLIVPRLAQQLLAALTAEDSDPSCARRQRSSADRPVRPKRRCRVEGTPGATR